MVKGRVMSLLSRRVVLALMFVALLVPALPAASVHAAGNTQYVSAYLDSPGTLTDCRTVAANCNLRNALNAAADGDTIQFVQGTFGWPITYTLDPANGTLTVSHSVAIQGPGVDTLTVSGGKAVTVFTVNRGVTATISGLTIENGHASFGGGGIDTQGNLTLTNCVVTNNTVTSSGIVCGGGIIASGTLALVNTTVSNNTITSAGTTNGVDISGPAIYQAAGALTITNSTISGNLGVLGGTTNGVSGQSDAAISVSGGNVTVRNTTISGNTAATGANILSSGALDLLDPAGTTSVTNSTLNDNRGGTLNGGIYTQGTLTLASTTIARNHADTFGGLYVFGGSTTLTDTLIADNTGSRTDGYGNISSASANNRIGDGGGFSGIINGSNGNQIGTTGNPINPRLDPNGLQPNGSIGPKTIALSPNSPAIEADGACPNGVRADERGQPRVGNCDIGAYEYQPVLPTVMNATGPVTGGPVTFHGIGFQTGSRLTLGSPFSASRDAPASAVSADGTSMTLDLPAGAAAGPVAGA